MVGESVVGGFVGVPVVGVPVVGVPVVGVKVGTAVPCIHIHIPPLSILHPEAPLDIHVPNTVGVVVVVYPVRPALEDAGADVCQLLQV